PGDRATQAVLSARGMGRQADDRRKGDREGFVTGSVAGTITSGASGPARRARRGGGVEATGSPRTAAADARWREASLAQGEPRAAAGGRMRGSPLDRLREPGRAG